MIEMTNELVTKWVEALESGEFNQCQSALHSNSNGTSGYCCLGVLAEIAQPNSWTQENGSTFNHPLQQVDEDEYLDEEKIDFSQEKQSQYAALNDNGASFIEIAKVLREDFNV